ncbi:MAG: hypothetical protein ACO295_05235 [Sediminibacterium sp.]
MDIKTKSSLITEFLVENDGEEEFEEFFQFNNIGIPLAVSITNNLVEKLTPEGERYIEETWGFLCATLDIDPDGQYNGIEDIIDFDEEDGD